MNTAKSTSRSRFIDQGMRSYMLGVYNYMGTALALSGITAYLAAYYGFTFKIMRSPLSFIVTFAPLAISMYFQFKISNLSVKKAKQLFFIYAFAMGLSLSVLFLAFSLGQVAEAFFIASATFLGCSIYGYTTKKDLTSVGSFAFMALWGMFIASIVNMFVKNPNFSYGISILAVFVFTALTAYDTQKIKSLYQLKGYMSDEDHKKASILGALQLYVDFIALFVHLLQLLNRRRD